ncbi:exonuclease [Shigella virus Moo19]|uniref:PD-(D/E)XK endonuclease-like domain-containing protein n=1 Tax=Shigella virus Moo19 TaxID=2886042 RepID=A0AAE8YCR5_9CAUD|nr:exonuclease [Shigella virus Moo19]UEN68853.1 hypothetical protein Moo19_gp57 [Shigella virus Moo19]
MKITNEHDVSLALAVWLLYDEYDYVDNPKYLSATTLLKPLKQIVMKHRVDFSNESIDVMDFAQASMGTGLHDSIEKAWKLGHKSALKKLGYPDRVVNAVVINPTKEDFDKNPNLIPVYIERRGTKNLRGWLIGGKFDIVTEGLLQDFKSTSTYSWVAGSRDDEHKMQGSIYRWIHDDVITEDVIRINYIFTDFVKYMAANNPKYPARRIMHKDIPLLSYERTEAWLNEKLQLIEKYWDAPESEIPECTDEELWRTEPQFKYFSDPTKVDVPGARSTKNFDDMISARKFMAEKGGKGAIKVVEGQVKRCEYCAVAPICKQRERYFPS